MLSISSHESLEGDCPVGSRGASSGRDRATSAAMRIVSAKGVAVTQQVSLSEAATAEKNALSKIHYEQWVAAKKAEAATKAADKAIREAKKELAKPGYSAAKVERWMKKANEAIAESKALNRRFDRLAAREDRIRDEGLRPRGK